MSTTPEGGCQEDEVDELLRPFQPPEAPKPAVDMTSILEAVTEIRMHPSGDLTLEDVTAIVSRALNRNGYKLKEVEQASEPTASQSAPAKKAKQSATKKTKNDT